MLIKYENYFKLCPELKELIDKHHIENGELSLSPIGQSDIISYCFYYGNEISDDSDDDDEYGFNCGWNIT